MIDQGSEPDHSARFHLRNLPNRREEDNTTWKLYGESPPVISTLGNPSNEDRVPNTTFSPSKRQGQGSPPVSKGGQCTALVE